MNKINLKTTLIWLIIILLSLALIISNFSINTHERQNIAVKKINGYTINTADIQAIIQNFSNYKKIQHAETELRNLIEKNIEYNTAIKNSDITITEKELLNEIITLDTFKKQDVFKPELYNAYLKDTNISEINFQKKIKIFLEQNSIKNALKILNNKRTKTTHFSPYLKFQINKTKIQTESNNLCKDINIFDIKYKDISINKTAQNFKITKNDLNAHQKRNKNKYNKPKLTKVNHIFIKKTNNNYKYIKNKIKNKQDIKQDIKNLNQKIIWITNNELNENLIENYTTNISITKTHNGLHIIHLIKNTQPKIYKNNIVSIDITNNYKKFKAIKKINHEIANYKHDLSVINNIFNSNITTLQIKNSYGILSLKQIKPWFFTQKLTRTTKQNIIKINNNRYLILELDNKKNYDQKPQHACHTQSYLNKIKIEKNILKTLLKIKNKKKNYPKDTHLKQSKNYFVQQHLNEHTTKIIKYKNSYFLLK